MNEPMPEHVRRVGAQATVDLWAKLRDIIHGEHPGSGHDLGQRGDRPSST
jgi:hypothetical protein